MKPSTIPLVDNVSDPGDIDLDLDEDKEKQMIKLWKELEKIRLENKMLKKSNEIT